MTSGMAGDARRSRWKHKRLCFRREKCQRRKTSGKTYSEKLHNGLGEAHHIHGYSYCVSKGKYQADGASKLWAQTPGNQVIGSTWRRGESQRKLKTVVSLKPKTEREETPTSAHESIGGNGGGREAGDSGHHGCHEDNQTRECCKTTKEHPPTHTHL